MKTKTRPRRPNRSHPPRRVVWIAAGVAVALSLWAASRLISRNRVDLEEVQVSYNGVTDAMKAPCPRCRVLLLSKDLKVLSPERVECPHCNGSFHIGQFFRAASGEQQ